MSEFSGQDLCYFPAASPPDGVIPNFVDPESLATTTFAFGIILTSCATLVVTVRLYINWGKLNWADCECLHCVTIREFLRTNNEKILWRSRLL